MGVTDRFNDNHFKLILKYIDSLEKQKIFSLKYIGNNKNDSIYKSIYDYKFQYFYDHNMLQKIDFTNVKKDGVYLVITFLLQISSAMGGALIQVVVVFFQILYTNFFKYKMEKLLLIVVLAWVEMIVLEKFHKKVFLSIEM